MMQSQIIEQLPQMPYDSADFTMNTLCQVATPLLGFVQPQNTSMNEWEEEQVEEDEEKYGEEEVIQETDPDLEDGEEADDDNDCELDGDDDDEFEQYLFGENDD